MLENATVSHITALRAIDELRRQQGIVIRETTGHAVANYPVEFLDDNLFAGFRSPSLRVLITAARAKAIGLPAQDTKIEAGDLSLPEIMALCGLNVPHPAGGRLGGGHSVTPEQASPHPNPPPMGEGIKYSPASEVDSMALRLAKDASLLPALLLSSDIPPGWLTVSVEDIRRYIDAPIIQAFETARAKLPMEGMENASIASFRSLHGTSVHLAIMVGNTSDNPLTRIHSSCVTGDILGSLRCDCGDQLKLAMAEIKKEGSGILLYLHQEGRGIGITNKLRAYQLQEKGFDTYDANLMLGFEEDERNFTIAAAILKKLGISRIRMLTNNPHKMAAIEKAGIKVTAHVPLVAPSGKHNHGYLEAKGKKAGHLF